MVSKKARLKRQAQQGDRIPIKVEQPPMGRWGKAGLAMLLIFCLCFMTLLWAAVGSAERGPKYSFDEMYVVLASYVDNWERTHPHLDSWEIVEPTDDLGWTDEWRQPVNIVLYIDEEATPAEVAEWERFFTKWTAETVGVVRNYSGYTTEVRRIDADMNDKNKTQPLKLPTSINSIARTTLEKLKGEEKR